MNSQHVKGFCDLLSCNALVIGFPWGEGLVCVKNHFIVHKIDDWSNVYKLLKARLKLPCVFVVV